LSQSLKVYDDFRPEELCTVFGDGIGDF